MSHAVPAAAIVRRVESVGKQGSQLPALAAGSRLQNAVLRRYRIVYADDVAASSPLGKERAHSRGQVVRAVAGSRSARIEKRCKCRIAFNRYGDVGKGRVNGSGGRTVRPAACLQPGLDGRGQGGARDPGESHKASDVIARGVGLDHRTRVVKHDAAHGSLSRLPDRRFTATK